MDTYVIRRKGGWRTPEELQEAAERSRRVGTEEMANRIQWVRSYLVNEPDGTLGTVCIYQASDPGAIQEHARRANLPADEILPVGETVVIREDPA